jgi:hypothetical protein
VVKDKLYLIASYKTKIIRGSVCCDWDNDLRAQLFGSKTKFLKHKILHKRLDVNSEILYSGEFYHLYNSIRRKNVMKDKVIIKKVLQQELEVIGKCNIVIAVIDEYFSYYSAIKLFDAIIKNKKVTVFIDDENKKIYEKWYYFLQICKNININTTVITNTICYNDIMEYIGKLEKTLVFQNDFMNYGYGKVLEETRLFISTEFIPASKKNISVDNISKLLKNDLRIMIVSEPSKSLIENIDTSIKNKRYLKYNGSFYYYAGIDAFNKEVMNFYKEVPKAVMKRIASSDIFISVLRNKEQIDAIIELLYAAFLGKKIYVFYDKSIMGNNIDNSYNFILLFAKMLDNDIKLINTVDNNKILEFIMDIE